MYQPLKDYLIRFAVCVGLGLFMLVLSCVGKWLVTDDDTETDDADD